MSRDGVSGVSRACLGRVSGVSRRVSGWCLGVSWRDSGWCLGKKKHDLHLSYTTKRTTAQGTIKSGLPLMESPLPKNK